MIMYYEILVFGSFGFYLVLTGSVMPVSVPHINRNGLKLRAITPEPDNHSLVVSNKIIYMCYY